MKTETNTDNFPFEVLLRLNDMLSRIVDAREAYHQASSYVEGYPRLKQLFEIRAKQRDRFVIELQEMVARFGKTLEQEMTLEQTWKATVRSLKDLFSRHAPAQVLDECLATEQKTVDEYELLVKMPTIPRELRDLLGSQRKTVAAEIADLKLARADLVG